jgi:hypothetical protein
LIVALEPCQNGLRSLGRNENIESALSDPSPHKRTKGLGFATFVRPGLRHWRFRNRLSASSADGKSQSLQDAASLMGIEIGSVEACQETEDLLWRKAPTGYHGVVLRDGFGHFVAESPLYIFSVKDEGPICDNAAYLIHTYCIALTDLSQQAGQQQSQAEGSVPSCSLVAFSVARSG